MRALPAIVALPLFATACLVDSGPPEKVVSTARPVAAIAWTSVVNATALPDPNDLYKSTGTDGDWDAGAISLATIQSRGAVEFTTAEEDKTKTAGLNHNDTGAGLVDIDFGIRLNNGNCQAIEAGTLKGSVEAYDPGDKFRIEVNGNVVTYSHDGSVLYTNNSAAAIFPLFFDTSLRDTGATIHNVQMWSRTPPDITWSPTSFVYATASPDANDLRKTGTQSAWDAGAVSDQIIESRGFVEFTTAETNKLKAAGLNQNNTGAGIVDLDFALRLREDAKFRVIEAGILKDQVRPYAAGDLFRIEVKHTATEAIITYSQNGAVFYTSNAPSTTKDLFFDTSLYTPGATIRDVVMTDAVRVSTQNSQLVSGRLSCGANDVGQNDVVVISGRYLGENADVSQFVALTESDIMNLLDNPADPEAYLQAFPLMRDYPGTLILDIESPGPRGLWNHDPSDRYDIVEAYKMRIDVVRSKFPNAKLGLYQTLNPDPLGNEDNSYHYVQRHDALVEAGAQGLYDNLDYLVPVLYVRFGPGDGAGKWDKLDEYTQLGITGSRDLANLPLLPFLTVYVHELDIDTNYHGWMLRDLDIANPFYVTLGAQLDILAANNVDEAALWIGAGNNYDNTEVLTLAEADNSPPVTWTIDDYACAF